MLETNRLLLREFVEHDWQAVHQFRSDPEVARYMEFEPNTEQQTREWVGGTMFHNQQRPRSSYNLAVVLKANHQVIGHIGVGLPSPSHSKTYEREYAFGYCLNRQFWGRGYMTEALRALLAFAFDELDAQYIFGECDMNNSASARVMEKVGMRLEGRVREQDSETGEWDESLRYGILSDEWRNK